MYSVAMIPHETKLRGQLLSLLQACCWLVCFQEQFLVTFLLWNSERLERASQNEGQLKLVLKTWRLFILLKLETWVPSDCFAENIMQGQKWKRRPIIIKNVLESKTWRSTGNAKPWGWHPALCFVPEFQAVFSEAMWALACLWNIYTYIRIP